MSLSIEAITNSQVVEAGEESSFELTVRNDYGQPMAAVNLRFSLAGNLSTELADRKVTTDSTGKARIRLKTGTQAEKVTVNATASDATWQGTLYVTDLRIAPHHGLDLKPVEETLLRLLYWNKAELHILQQFGGGLSGSRVLKVQAFDAHGTEYLPQVVKIGSRDETRAEHDNYEKHFKNRLPNAAPVAGYAEQGFKAAVIYGDATAEHNLEKVMPLADYFDRHDSDDIHAALGSIFEVGLRRVYRHYQVKPRTYQQLFATVLPENLVVGLDAGADNGGVYPQGRLPQVPPDAVTLRPVDIERASADLRPSTPGAVVVLAGFLISKMQDDDLNLEDPHHERYRVKVRYQGTAVTGVTTGDRVDVVARLITDRRARMRFAVDDCLKQHGLKKHARGFCLGAEVYPDPLELLFEVLDEHCDVAWGTIHGDLHWDNVMLEGPSNWRLIDYGMTKTGPVLFDFIKLELYLRRTQLAKLADLKPEQLLAFEQALVDDPLGHLPGTDHGHPALNKASEAIQAIRRMARRYLVDDSLGYWRFLFIYAMALTKYYPSAEKWRGASQRSPQGADLQESSRLCWFALAPALAAGRVLAWERACRKRPSLPYAFRPIASPLTPQKGAMTLAVGLACQPGVIDHHAMGEGRWESTTSLVWKQPGFITDHLTADDDPDTIGWIVPESPTFDCAAAVYLAWCRAKLGFFPSGAAQLQQYTLEVSAGAAFLDTVLFPDRTPLALLLLHGNEWNQMDTPTVIDRKFMDNGLEVLDYLCRLEVTGVHPLAANRVPHEHGFWNATMGRDERIFEAADRANAEVFTVRLGLAGQMKSCQGLAMKSPRSLFFKTWARRSGYPVLAVCWPHPRLADTRRIVVSVPPHYAGALKGLGKALEKAENERRAQLGKDRPKDNPRWPDVDNNDPWYDGRLPVHNYTIVDSPREGTVLTLSEVLDIVKHSRRWRT